MAGAMLLRRSTDGFAATADTAAVPIAPQDLGFLICVEDNVLGAQAILLCESLRRHGGRYRSCPVWAVSPRPGRAPAPEVAAALGALGVTCIVQDLNTTGSAYGSVNRIVAAAWAESRIGRPYLCVLDTDMIFLTEPDFLEADAGVRPVDVKGTASTGPDDGMEPYWQAICGLAGLRPDHLPMLETTVCRTRIRASYNGGFLVARTRLGILETTRRIFFDSFRQGLQTRPGQTAGIYASTGDTGPEAARWWGSSQAAMSAAIAARSGAIRIYGPGYNIPLHLGAQDGRPPFATGTPVLAHYHFLAAERHRTGLLRALDCIGCPPPVRDWIGARCATLDWSDFVCGS